MLEERTHLEQEAVNTIVANICNYSIIIGLTIVLLYTINTWCASGAADTSSVLPDILDLCKLYARKMHDTTLSIQWDLYHHNPYLLDIKKLFLEYQVNHYVIEKNLDIFLARLQQTGNIPLSHGITSTYMSVVSDELEELLLFLNQTIMAVNV